MRNIFQVCFKKIFLFVTLSAQLSSANTKTPSNCIAFYENKYISIIFSSSKANFYYNVLKKIALKRNWKNDILITQLKNDFLTGAENLQKFHNLKAVTIETSQEGFTIKGVLSPLNGNELTFIISSILSESLDYGEVKKGLSLNFSKFMYAYLEASRELFKKNPSIMQVKIWPIIIVNPTLRNMLEQVGFEDDGIFNLKFIKDESSIERPKAP